MLNRGRILGVISMIALAAIMAACAGGGIGTQTVSGDGGSSSSASSGAGGRQDDKTFFTCSLLGIEDTYECFEGRISVAVAGGPENIRVQPEPVFEQRRPITTLNALNASGRNLTGPISEASGRIEAPGLKRYAERVLARLLVHSPLPAPPIAVHITGDVSFKASATPSNDIFVSIGVLNVVKTEDQLAAILAHEASHILLNHFNNEELIEAQREITGTIHSAVFVGSNIMHGQFGDQPGGGFGFSQTEANKKDAEKTRQTATVATEALNFVARDVVASAWNRQQEDEADLLSMDMLTRAGYSQPQALKWFDILIQAQAEHKTALAQLKVKQDSLDSAMKGDLTLQSLTGAMMDNLGGALAALWTDTKSYFRRLHLDPEKRRKHTRGYLRERWRTIEFETTAPESGLEQAQQSAELKRLMDRYRTLGRARTAMAEGNFNEAERLRQQAMRGSVAKDAPAVEFKADLLAARGDLNGAMAALREVRRGDPLSVSAYTKHATWLISLNRPEDALQVLDRAETIYPEDLFYQERMLALSAAERLDELEALKRKCLFDPELEVKRRCERALEQIPASRGGRRGQAGASASGASGGGIGGFFDNLGAGIDDLVGQ